MASKKAALQGLLLELILSVFEATAEAAGALFLIFLREKPVEGAKIFRLDVQQLRLKEGQLFEQIQRIRFVKARGIAFAIETAHRTEASK